MRGSANASAIVGRSVMRAIVDDDQLPIRIASGPDRLDRLSDRLGVVVRRHDDGERWGGARHAYGGRFH